jgi:hypothetical protein
MAKETDAVQAAEAGKEVPAATAAPLPDEPTPATPRLRRSRGQRVGILLGSLLLVYLATAYITMPGWWRWYGRRHSALVDLPDITHTGSHIPGDPVNVALIGTETELKKLMLAAQWFPADALTLRSCLLIAKDTVLKRSYDAAPVSNLYLWGRKQDLAFEQPVGNNPRHRHHVRFWRSDKQEDGRPIWIGAAIYDEKVGLSHTTGQITHHTARDIDTEREKLFRDLRQTGVLSEFVIVPEFHKVRNGRNGGGDPWETDGSLYAGVIKAEVIEPDVD